MCLFTESYTRIRSSFFLRGRFQAWPIFKCCKYTTKVSPNPDELFHRIKMKSALPILSDLITRPGGNFFRQPLEFKVWIKFKQFLQYPYLKFPDELNTCSFMQNQPCRAFTIKFRFYANSQPLSWCVSYNQNTTDSLTHWWLMVSHSYQASLTPWCNYKAM